MNANCCTNSKDVDIAYLRKFFFNKLFNSLSIRSALGVRDKHLTRISVSPLSSLSHNLNNASSCLLFATCLLFNSQRAVGLDIHNRTNVKHAAKQASCLRNATAANKEGQICREEPAIHTMTCFFSPCNCLVKRQAFIAFIGKTIYQETITRRCLQRVNNLNLSVRELLLNLYLCLASRLVCSRNART